MASPAAAGAASDYIDARNTLVLELLQSVEELYSIQVELNDCLRQGFFGLTRARLSSAGSGPSSYSALDTRERLNASFRVRLSERSAEEVLSSLGVKAPGGIGAMYVMRRALSAADEQSRGSQYEGLRQRGHGSDGNESVGLLSEPTDPPVADTLDLYGGLVPPQLRKAKRDFSAGLAFAIRAATINQKVMILLKTLRQNRDEAGDLTESV
jgi:hypothetical protein